MDGIGGGRTCRPRLAKQINVLRDEEDEGGDQEHMQHEKARERERAPLRAATQQAFERITPEGAVRGGLCTIFDLDRFFCL